MVWDPFREVERIEKDIEQEFKKFFKHNEDYFVKSRGFRKALTNFKDRGKTFEVSIILPGIQKKDIIVRAHDRVVEVRAERNDSMEIKKKSLFQRKESFGSFYKVIPLPDEADSEKLKTEFKKGTLVIKIAKKKKKKHRMIKIK